MNRIVFDENLAWLARAPRGAFSLVYIDPPFNTGRRQTRTRVRTVADRDGDRVGFGGRRYRTERLGETGFDDRFDDYVGFLRDRIEAARPTLTPDASLFLHVDSREVHYCKVMLDEVFGRESFMNEIIWAYDYGARSKRRWSPKHDNLLWYVNDPARYTFNFDEIDRIPYMAPGLVGPEKAARGKTPTDVWWHTIVSPTGREKTGYATQKPLGILERIVRVHSNPGDRVLDFFAGSGSFGEAAARHDRGFVLVDNNPEAVRIMRKRLAAYAPEFECGDGLVEEETFEPAERPEPKGPAARVARPEPTEQLELAEQPGPAAPPTRAEPPELLRPLARAPRCAEASPHPTPTRGGPP